MPGIGYIGFHSPINTSTTNQLLAASQQIISANQVDHIYYLFSTQGGGVQDGIRLYNSIKNLPVETTMHNMGNIDSIGNAVFLAGQNRFACPNSTFMFHGVGFDIKSARFERKDLEERLDGILADEQKIGGIITNETSLTGDDLDEFFRQATTKNADFALKHGFISEIRTPTIDSTAPYIHLVLS